jgi:hypothetical protein
MNALCEARLQNTLGALHYQSDEIEHGRLVTKLITKTDDFPKLCGACSNARTVMLVFGLNHAQVVRIKYGFILLLSIILFLGIRYMQMPLLSQLQIDFCFMLEKYSFHIL